MFNIGDWVKCIESNWDASVKVGDISQVKEFGITNDCVFLTKGGSAIMAHRLVPHTPMTQESELERLVRVANEGEDAERLIRSIYRDRVEVNVVFPDGSGRDNKWEACEGPVGVLKYRVKPKPVEPAFKPFSISISSRANALVSHCPESKTIKIGCTNFPIDRLEKGLNDLLEGNVTYCNYLGERYQALGSRGIAVGDYVVSWNAAILIQDALNKVKMQGEKA